MPLSATDLQVLQSNPWFAKVPRAEREALCAAAKPVPLQAGAMVFRQGDAAQPEAAFFALLKGSIKLSTLRADGREAILGLLEAGNWFGEISLIDGSPRAHDATALAPCRLLAVSCKAFAARMQSPAFAQAMAGLLTSRVRALYGLMEDATLRSLRARVARRLLTLARGDATRSDDLRPTVRVPQEALAMMLGVSRQTLSKELHALAAAGAIAVGYRRIDIVSSDALLRLAEDAGALRRS